MHGKPKEFQGGLGMPVRWDTVATGNPQRWQLRNEPMGVDIHGYSFRTRRQTESELFSETKPIIKKRTLLPKVAYKKIEVSPVMVNPSLGASKHDL